MIETLTPKELAQIRRRWEEFSYSDTSTYRAFMQCAHDDVGKLLAHIDSSESDKKG